MPSPERAGRRGVLAAGIGGALALMSGPGLAAPAEVSVFGAGSLKAALTEIAAAFEGEQPGTRVVLTFGASGLLKDRLMAGERADVFASANMDHPQALVDAGRAQGVRRFALNQLCALAAPALGLTPERLVDALLDPAVRLGTSTPKADPSGDYAWTMFERIERQGRPGAFKALSGKALQLTGGPDSPKPASGRNVYGELVAGGAADVFITYCTNATVAAREQPALRVVDIPAPINVGASYGVTTLAGAGEAARRFVDFLLGPAGQGLLARHGFAPG